jgi:MYXO-CTERM domain-containing protein
MTSHHKLLALSLFVLASAAALPASAIYQCGPDKDDCKCGMNDPYPCCSNGGNCTWWAWEQACCHWSVGRPGWGNANQWAGNAKANPKYDVLKSPVPGSIATRVSGSYGHVAWVTKVNGSQITVTEQNCWGGWGHQTSTYNASYFDGGFVVPHADCECSPGQTQTETCGNCGERKRTCGSTCKWNSWGSCGGEGACAPGATEEQGCGDCGTQARTCKNDCSWGSFGTCEGTDPTGAAATCDTGKPGVCAKGTKTCASGNTECVATTEPSEEICDELDNDCDGEVDEGVCWETSPIDAGTSVKPKRNDLGSSTDGQDSSDMSGGMSCAVSPNRSGSASLLGLLALAWATTRRRRRLDAARQRR